MKRPGQLKVHVAACMIIALINPMVFVCMCAIAVFCGWKGAVHSEEIRDTVIAP